MKYGTDYSKTAIDLNNPNEVFNLLMVFGKARDNADATNKTLEEATKDLPEKQAAVKAQAALMEAYLTLKEAIDSAGSYQDVAEGLYALKQSRTSVNYDPTRVREQLPQYADAVINQTVDGAKIHGLHKGGLITEDDLKRITITTDLSPAYIIDIVVKPKEVASA